MCHTLITTGNIYDEPSLPDPVYQEVGTNLPELIMEMTENDSYGEGIKEKITLQGCPAYVCSRNPELT